jgi:hypothetical protein
MRATALVLALVLPAPVLSVGAVPNADGSVTIFWTLPADPTVVGVTIFRERWMSSSRSSSTSAWTPVHRLQHGLHRQLPVLVHTRDASRSGRRPSWRCFHGRDDHVRVVHRTDSGAGPPRPARVRGALARRRPPGRVAPPETLAAASSAAHDAVEPPSISPAGPGVNAAVDGREQREASERLAPRGPGSAQRLEDPDRIERQEQVEGGRRVRRCSRAA